MKKFRIGLLRPEKSSDHYMNLLCQYGKVSIIMFDDFSLENIDLLIIPSYANFGYPILGDQKVVEQKMTSLFIQYRDYIQPLLARYKIPMIFLGDSGIFELPRKASIYLKCPHKVIKYKGGVVKLDRNFEIKENDWEEQELEKELILLRKGNKTLLFTSPEKTFQRKKSKYFKDTGHSIGDYYLNTIIEHEKAKTRDRIGDFMVS